MATITLYLSGQTEIADVAEFFQKHMVEPGENVLAFLMVFLRVASGAGWKYSVSGLSHLFRQVGLSLGTRRQQGLS